MKKMECDLNFQEKYKLVDFIYLNLIAHIE